MDWPQALKDYRRRHGLTQAALAETLSIDPTTVSRWERGRDQPALGIQRRLRSLVMPHTSDVERALRMLVDASDAIAVLCDSNYPTLQSSPRYRELLRLETAINNMTHGLCFFDGDERLIVCNQRFVEMYDLDPARVRAGIALSKIVDMQYDVGSCPKMSKEDYLAWRNNAGNASGVSDTVHELANGRVIHIHYRPMADGAWAATYDDITERRKLSQCLEDRAVLLQAIIDNFPGAIGYFDRDLRVAVCNDKTKSILDLPEALFADGSPRLEDLIRFNAERGEYGPGNPEEQIATKVALAKDRHTYHFERQRPDGTVLDVRGAPIDNGGFLTTYMDITEPYRSEAKIAHMATHDALTRLAKQGVVPQAAR